MEAGSVARAALTALESQERGWTFRRLRWWTVAAVLLVFYAVCWQLAQVDPAKLATGLPKLLHWLSLAWPPRYEELPLFLHRTAETVAMAALGTTGLYEAK